MTVFFLKILYFLKKFTQILPRLWTYIEIIVLEQINDSSSPAEKHWWGMPKHKSRTRSGFQVVTQCLTQLETWQQSANHGWLIFPHLRLSAPQEMLFLHWIKVSVLEGTCRKIHHGAVASQKSPCSVLARWDCVLGVPVRARSAPQAFCTDLPSFPRNQGHSSSFSYLCKVL